MAELIWFSSVFDPTAAILTPARWDVAETLSGGSREFTGVRRREKLHDAVYSFLEESYVEAKGKVGWYCP